MTEKRLKALFDRCNFLNIGCESDYMQLGRKAHRLYKHIEKFNNELTVLLGKKLQEKEFEESDEEPVPYMLCKGCKHLKYTKLEFDSVAKFYCTANCHNTCKGEI